MPKIKNSPQPSTKGKTKPPKTSNDDKSIHVRKSVPAGKFIKNYGSIKPPKHH